MHLMIKVVPGASRDEIAGWLGEELKIRVAAPPEGGRANKAVIALLAQKCDLSRRNVRLVAGQTAPRKTVEIDDLEPAEMRRRIDAVLAKKG